MTDHARKPLPTPFEAPSLRCQAGIHHACQRCGCRCHDRQPELPLPPAHRDHGPDLPCDHHGGYRAAAGVAWCRRCGIDLEVAR